jgi:hypothetical protein
MEIAHMNEQYENIGTVMSNFDHEVKPGAEDKLKSGLYFGEYTAWEFFGEVWFNLDDKVFECRIRRHRVHIDTIRGDALKKIMTTACERWGYD